MSNVIIIGSGPAGISAALYTARAGVETLVIGGGAGALAKADRIENYYGFAEPVAAKDLLAAGIAQARHAGAEVLEDEVVGIGFGTKLTVSTQSQEYEADYVVLATGASRSTPPIPGLRELEGHGVSYCAVCDAFFYRGKDVAVLGSGEYAMHEAAELLPVVGSVTVLTNGAPLTGVLPEGARLDTRKISAFAGDGVVERAEFEDGESLPISGVFVAVGVAGSTDLAKKLGAATEGTRILVDEKMATNVPGLYAAGDCTGGMLQIAKAVYQGAQAGTSIVAEIRKKK